MKKQRQETGIEREIRKEAGECKVRTHSFFHEKFYCVIYIIGEIKTLFPFCKPSYIAFRVVGPIRLLVDNVSSPDLNPSHCFHLNVDIITQHFEQF